MVTYPSLWLEDLNNNFLFLHSFFLLQKNAYGFVQKCSFRQDKDGLNLEMVLYIIWQGNFTPTLNGPFCLKVTDIASNLQFALYIGGKEIWALF